MTNIYDFDPDAASRRRHPTVTDYVYDDELTDEDVEGITATLYELCTQAKAKTTGVKQTRLSTDAILMVWRIVFAFVVVTTAVAWLAAILIAISTASGARP